MKKVKILWTDDEIDLLMPHIIFLREKGYDVEIANNGADAIEMVKSQQYDLVFLDENMPGVSGLEALAEIKRYAPSLPVVMVTKSEEEDIMDLAIGSQISDYLIKPVKPLQVLLTIKKHIDKNRLVSEKTTQAYQSDFRNLSFEINDSMSFGQWSSIYKKLVFWELELEKSKDDAMDEVFKMQKQEANSEFAKFIKRKYVSWFENLNNTDKPLLSPSVFKDKVFPILKSEKVYVLLIDNLRYDQWKILEPIFSEKFNVIEDDIFCSILPTATQYSRNSMFSGLMPSEMQKLYPDIWLNDEDDGGKNLHEEEMLGKQIQRNGINKKFNYEKITNNKAARKYLENINTVCENDLMVGVFNFVDMLSHARTEMDVIRQLAEDESAYRSITVSWFEHSPIYELIKIIAEKKIKLVITTDHGTVRVNNPVKIVGDRNTTTNLRYKQGRSLKYNPKEVFEIEKPSSAYLPSTNISSSYVFSLNNDFFAYPNNYNYYVKHYKDTFQHGGVSLQEMLIPIITLEPK